MESINVRFFRVLEELGLSGYKFAKMASISEASVSNIKNGKNKPSIDIIEWILNNYEAVSADFLLRGIGDALLNTSENPMMVMEGNNNAMNYKSKNKSHNTKTDGEQTAQLLTEITRLKKELALKDELLSLYRKTNIDIP